MSEQMHSPHADLMDIRFAGFDPETETATLHFTAPESFITPRGSVQGGLVAGFLDEVMGWAHVHATGHEEAPLNVEISMTLLKPVMAGPLVGVGRVVRRGRRVSFLEAELFDEAGTLLARATSTAFITKRPGSE